MKGDQIGTRTAHPSPRELPLSNQTRFSHARVRLPRGPAGEAQRGHIAQKGAAQPRPLVALSMGEIRRLISGLQRAAGIVLDHLFGWSLWRRIHQAIAKHCHWQRHQREAYAQTQLQN